MYTIEDLINQRIGIDVYDKTYWWPWHVRQSEKGPVVCLMFGNEILVDEEWMTKEGWQDSNVINANRVPPLIRQRFIVNIFLEELRCG